MQEDFHYYATYCASYLAGFSHEESLAVCYSAQFVDHCSVTLLKKIKAPASAATTQLQLEMMDARTDLIGRQNITRIWSSFHFLPQDLHAECPGGKLYQSKYRLICGPCGELVTDTVELAKGKGPEAIGIAMHVLADTWAHRYFAGTPSLVINNTNGYFYELADSGGSLERKKITFHRNVRAADDPAAGKYVNSLYQAGENNIMNLGHGRAGHLPDYSFIRYAYLPAWGEYREIIKDNPSDYYHAFCQMVHALRYLSGNTAAFDKDAFDFETVKPYESEIREILTRRRLSASEDWKAFGEKLSGERIGPFDIEAYQKEYIAAAAEEKETTAPGKFFKAAQAQKSMVTDRIFSSGNWLAGISRRISPADLLARRGGEKT